MLIIVLSLLTAIGLAALIHAVSHSDIGYENELGFHYGIEPVKVATPLEIPEKETTVNAPLAPRRDTPAKRSSRKAAKKTLREDPISTLKMEIDAGLPRLLGQEVGSVEKR